MKDEFVNQFDHLWRTFAAVVEEFDEQGWTEAGSGITTPARTAYHIVESTKYYTEDDTPIVYRSNKTLTASRKDLRNDELPTRDDVVFMIDACARRTARWLRSIDLDGENTKFRWTGKTNLSVVLFLLRHSQYHLGEINALLNESMSGNAADHFANTVPAY